MFVCFADKSSENTGDGQQIIKDWNWVGDILLQQRHGTLYKTLVQLIEAIPEAETKERAWVMLRGKFRTSHAVRDDGGLYDGWNEYFQHQGVDGVGHKRCFDPETNKEFHTDLMEALVSYGMCLTVQCQCDRYDDNDTNWHQFWRHEHRLIIVQPTPEDVSSIPSSLIDAAETCGVDLSGDERHVAQAYYDVCILNYLGHGISEHLDYPFGSIIPPTRHKRDEAARWRCKRCVMKDEMSVLCQTAGADALLLAATKDAATEAIASIGIADSSACEVVAASRSRDPKEVFRQINETFDKTTKLVQERVHLRCSMPGCALDAAFFTSRDAKSVPITDPRSGALRNVVPSSYAGTGGEKMVCNKHKISTYDPPNGEMGIWFLAKDQRRAVAEHNLNVKCKFTFAALAIEYFKANGEGAAGPMCTRCRDYNLEAFLRMPSDDCDELLRELGIDPMKLPCSDLRSIDGALVTKFQDAFAVGFEVTRRLTNVAGAVIDIATNDGNGSASDRARSLSSTTLTLPIVAEKCPRRGLTTREEQELEGEESEQDEEPKQRPRPGTVWAARVRECEGRGIGKRVADEEEPEDEAVAEQQQQQQQQQEQQEQQQEGEEEEADAPFEADADEVDAEVDDASEANKATPVMVEANDALLKESCNRHADPETGALVRGFDSDEDADVLAALEKMLQELKVGSNWMNNDPGSGHFVIGEEFGHSDDNNVYAHGFCDYDEVNLPAGVTFDRREQGAHNIIITKPDDLTLLRDRYRDSIAKLQDWSYPQVMHNFSHDKAGVCRKSTSNVILPNQGNRHVQFGWHTDEKEVYNAITHVTHIVQLAGRSIFEIAGKGTIVLEGKQSVMFDGRLWHRTVFAEEGTVKFIMQYGAEMATPTGWKGPFAAVLALAPAAGSTGRTATAAAKAAAREAAREAAAARVRQTPQTQSANISINVVDPSAQPEGQRFPQRHRRPAPTRDVTVGGPAGGPPRAKAPSKRRKNSPGSTAAVASGSSAAAANDIVNAKDVGKQLQTFFTKKLGFQLWPDQEGKMPPAVNRKRGSAHITKILEEFERVVKTRRSQRDEGESEGESEE